MEERQPKEIVITTDIINRYHEDQRIQKLLQDIISPKLRLSDTKYITNKILTSTPVIFSEILPEGHRSWNYLKRKINEDNKLKPETYLEARKKLIEFIQEDIKDFKEIVKNEEELEKTKEVDGKSIYLINKNTTKDRLRKAFCDDFGKCSFKYDFVKPDLKISKLETNNDLQYVKLQITSKPYPFGVYVRLGYNCSDRYNNNTNDICSSSEVQYRKYYEAYGKPNLTINCEGLIYTTDSEGREKHRKCNKTLYPVNDLSTSSNAYYYDINYKDKKETMISVPAFAFEMFEPGYYEAVVFCHTGNLKTPYYQIVDVKPIQPNNFTLPVKREDENYIFTLQKELDEFITKQTNDRIAGLIPIKCALILQKVATEIDFPLVFNLQIIGDMSSGKSWTLRRFGFMLNSNYHMSSNGLSISIPSLRGTRTKINIMNKEVDINKMGLLGTYKTIHIDEAGENEELVQNLKTFLVESDFSNNKAGADGIQHKRTAHINLSQNPSHEHLGAYRGAIKKAYNNVSQINDIPLENWNDDWDLLQPIDTYSNIYLKECINNQRKKLSQEKIFWMDGLDTALHDRFPFYFYMIDDKNEELKKVIKENARKKNVVEDTSELIKVLKNDVLDDFFKQLKQYNVETDIEVFDKVDEILKEFNLDLNSRQSKMFYNLIKLSIIINQRETPTTQDYDFLRYILSKINRCITLTELNNYNVTEYKKVDTIQPVNGLQKFSIKTDDNEVENDFK
jgi:hypothetical protein